MIGIPCPSLMVLASFLTCVFTAYHGMIYDADCYVCYVYYAVLQATETPRPWFVDEFDIDHCCEAVCLADHGDFLVCKMTLKQFMLVVNDDGKATQFDIRLDDKFRSVP